MRCTSYGAKSRSVMLFDGDPFISEFGTLYRLGSSGFQSLKMRVILRLNL